LVSDLKSINQWADFWRYECGLNVFPADTRNKRTYEEWGKWQNEPISEEQHEDWKNTNAFSNGMALMAGRVWHRTDLEKRHLCFIDLDNQKAIDEVCAIFGAKDIYHLSQMTIVEQHLDNLSKAHVYFYTKHSLYKKSSDVTKLKDKIDSNEIPAIEVKSLGEHGIAMCSPSIHKDGHNYEIVGSREIGTFDGKEIEALLVEVYKKYGLVVGNSQFGNNNRIPTKDLFKSDFVIKEGHNRSEAVMRVFESLYARDGNSKSLEKIRQETYDWMLEHCEPPLDLDKFERQVRDGRKFVDSNLSQNQGNTLLQQLKIKNEELLIYKIVDYSIPYKAYYVDEKLAQICYGKLTADGEIYPLKSIINIVPKKLKFYINPFFPKAEPKVELEFRVGSKNEIRKLGPYNSLTELLRELHNKGYVLNKSKAEDAFNSIKNAMEEKDENLIEYANDITTPGYYIIDGNWVTSDIAQSTGEIRKEDAIECCNLLNNISTGWKNKDIFPTVLKWGLIAPFAFIIKSNTDRWMPWLQLYGEGQSGKTTLGELAMFVWNIERRDSGFTDADTPAKFGYFVSNDTYPKMINEAGSMYTNRFGKYTPIIEMIKSSVEGLNARAKFEEYKNYRPIPALSPLIITSNFAPVSDGSYNRRFVSIHFPNQEKKSEEQQKAFEALMDKGEKYLKVLGDFAMQYISKDPTILLKENWKDISKKLLEEFYIFAEIDVPEWIGYFVEQKDAMDESNERTTFGLRAFLVNKVNELYLRHRGYNAESSHSYDDNRVDDLRKKLKYCVDNKLITFIHRYKKENDIVITRDIVDEINNSNTSGRIENITGLEDIGNQIGFQYKPREFNGRKTRVLLGDLSTLYEFLNPSIF
jgi:hypothetical protein